LLRRPILPISRGALERGGCCAALFAHRAFPVQQPGVARGKQPVRPRSPTAPTPPHGVGRREFWFVPWKGKGRLDCAGMWKPPAEWILLKPPEFPRTLKIPAGPVSRPAQEFRIGGGGIEGADFRPGKQFRKGPKFSRPEGRIDFSHALKTCVNSSVDFNLAQQTWQALPPPKGFFVPGWNHRVPPKSVVPSRLPSTEIGCQSAASRPPIKSHRPMWQGVRFVPRQVLVGNQVPPLLPVRLNVLTP